MLIDTHAHLDFDKFDADLAATIKRAQAAKVSALVNVGSSLAGSKKSVQLAALYPGYIYAAVGVHPDDLLDLAGAGFSKLQELVKSPGVVAIGEIGLDYYRNPTPEQIAQQKEFFVQQLNLAQDADLPVIIHCRDAFTDLLEILSTYKSIKGVVHCFGQDSATATKLLNLGLHISFTANITYPKIANEVLEAIKAIPLARILLETDSPFLAPQSYRGQRNEPAYVLEVAQKIAELKNITPEEVAKVTTSNAKKLFGLK